MNKPLCVAAVAALALNLSLCGASITVTSPSGGEFFPGSPVTITWTKAGDMQATVTIALRFASSAPTAAPALVIATGTTNDGSEPWKVPGTVAPGDYFIRVRTDDAAVIGDGAVFKISSTPTIAVTSPKTNDEWCQGNPYTITWTKSGTMQGTVAIRLRKAGSRAGASDVLAIADGAANTGSFPWTIPFSVPAGDYFVQVRTDDSAVIGDGTVFKIMACGVQIIQPSIPAEEPPPPNMIVVNRNQTVNPGQMNPLIRVSKPAAGSSISGSGSVPIEWSMVGGSYVNVKIFLYPAGQPHLVNAGQAVVLSELTGNDGFFDWKLTGMERTGKHVVRVQTPDGKLFGDSGVFTIAPATNVTPTRIQAPDIVTMLASQAKIFIQSLNYRIFSKGEVTEVDMAVEVNSDSGFVLTPALGHPQFGSLYARCVIEVPHTDKSGFFTATKIVDAIFSLKSAPPLKLNAQPAKIAPGEGVFSASFVPDCKGKALGQKVAISQKSTLLEGGKFCISEYYPKLTVTLHLVTRSGEVVAERSVYLRYDPREFPLEYMILPGEVNACTKKGVQEW
jgi:hypothetical protein